jgi:hypothetical protein
MRRDLDLIRHLLLTLEGEAKYLETEAIEAEARFKENYKDYEGEWNEHCRWLAEAGLIEGKSIKRSDGYVAIYPERLTWKGTEYLDSIRDKKIWAEVKKQLSRIGSFTLPIVQSIAENIIRAMLKI